jgi:molecular chaperone DnaK (HSP70)
VVRCHSTVSRRGLTDAKTAIHAGCVFYAVTGGSKEARFAPEEAAALVLAHLKQVAQKHFGPAQPVQQAMIAVPASFTAFQRQSLHNAARIAGLEVLGLVNETSAAAMAYLYKLKLSGDFPKGESHVLVFSLGAEHLEVSLATIDDGFLKVKAVAFDDRLGGRHFDDRLLAHLEALGSRLPWIGRLLAATALPSAGTMMEADSCHSSCCAVLGVLV